MPNNDAVGMEWKEFLNHFARTWKQGEHIAVCAPTGEGKTTICSGILRLRRWVLALDVKSGDRTLAGTGFPRTVRWPLPRDIKKDIHDGKPARLIIGYEARNRVQRGKNRALHRRVLEEVWDEPGWTLYIPDLQMLTDRRFGGMSDATEELLIAARDRLTSVVTDFQRPANVPRAAGDQAAWFIVGYTRDTDVVNRLAEMTGRPAAEIRGAVRGLASEKVPEHCWLIFSRKPREAIIVTRPDYIAPARRSSA